MKFLPATVFNHTFLPALFGEEPIILDFGVNDGSFAMTMIRDYGASVFGAEPSSALFRAQPANPKLHVENVAIAGSDGAAALELFTDRCPSIHPDNRGSSAGTEMVPVWGLRTFLSRCRIEAADLLKIDIEGAECDLLEASSDADLLRFAQVTIEFHDFMIGSLGPRVEAIKRRFVKVGFYCINFSLNNGDVLFVRRDLISPVYSEMLRGPYKYAMGALRRVNRAMGRPVG